MLYSGSTVTASSGIFKEPNRSRAYLFITEDYQCTETRSRLRQLYLTTMIIHQFKADPARKSGNAMQIESAYKSMFKEAMFCKFK